MFPRNAYNEETEKNEYRYIGLADKDSFLLVNLDTFEKKEYKKEIAMLDSGGNVYEKENIDNKSFRFRKIE